MLVGNWMQKDPVTISSDMTASKAIELFNELKVPFLPVVDEGKLRGILPRRDIRQAATCVTATDSIHEINYFNSRLKVKDLMVRKPITLSVDDTVDTALAKGAQFGRSFFPVMDADKLVGTVCNRDIVGTLHQILGVDKNLCAITLEVEDADNDIVKEIVSLVYSAGASIHSLFRLANPENGSQRLLIRFDTSRFGRVRATIGDQGYRIVEAIDPSYEVGGKKE